MCVCFWATPTPSDTLQRHPIFILAANRDEFLARKTLDADWHDFEPIHSTTAVEREGKVLPCSRGSGPLVHPIPLVPAEVSANALSGRDLGDPSGGTWLVVHPHRNGHGISIGVLTNIHDDIPPPEQDILSRGRLLRDWVKDRPLGKNPNAPDWSRRYLAGLAANNDRYAGYNLILFDVDIKDRVVSAHYHTNRSKSDVGDEGITLQDQTTKLAGLSNSVLSQPFRKVVVGMEGLGRMLEDLIAMEDSLVEQLCGLLGEISVSYVKSRDDLHETVCVPLCYMSGAGGADRPYGTRLSTVVVVYDDGAVVFVERDRLWLAEGTAEAQSGGRAERRFDFRLDA